MNQKNRWVFAMALVLIACNTSKEMAMKSDISTPKINWPAAYTPNEAGFFVHNEVSIAASPEKVWNILIQAETWPAWYKGAQDVQIIDNTNGILNSESVFTWKTMGMKFKSTIKEFVPNERLSWESEKSSIQGYHAWLIIPTETGCTLITDESQKGWLTFFEKIFQPKKLHRLHDIWLQEIKNKAEL